MADRVIDPEQTEVPDIDELLAKLLQYLVAEAQEKMDPETGFAPFVGVAIKDNLVLEEIQGEEPDELYRMAKHTVEGTRGAQAYGFCYDGYLDTSEGQKDAIIAEGGMAGQAEGYAVGLLYEQDPETGKIDWMPPVSYVGMAPNFMALLFNDELPAQPIPETADAQVAAAAEEIAGDEAAEEIADKAGE